ncbi:calcium channel, voltage-dependent, gamma subunit 6, isoform CRA_b [Rattus norvegicus]|uniref:Voltage-dependent calcium channel gamma-6 subunit n=2 Tax=Rattus norvegicus TaxID=10116 RepID=A6KS36_RAT|nr:voltage-dependent calcium channel gamma-6 subunit isoform X1 [Rattus norvegicus]AAL50039.1 voltage-dependent calcium channel gamma-6 subunit short isoform [Rattus norvegicus]EDL84944.1 calcium channel, voltage-dependent, gamma subunit 6, isoform CRA_b [Rattus norvegicus]|eukprot:XP_008756971.1 PREDICTED: voltage-dependent calcium channel gamma-6 subunit isoform X1 [Rattus norvegicus]
MMWSNFFMQEEDRRRTAVGRRRAQEQQNLGLTPEREGKIKLGLLVAIVGATLAVLAVGTEFWVELNTYKTNGSAVCEAAHLGLWKVCIKRLWQADVPAGRETCGPAELPGEANCTYFKFFTTGENAHIFQRTTKKGLLLFVSLEVFRHSVRALLQGVNPETPPAPRLAYEYSWSLGCGVGAGLILLLGGVCFLLLTLPSWPWRSLCPKRGGPTA